MNLCPHAHLHDMCTSACFPASFDPACSSSHACKFCCTPPTLLLHPLPNMCWCPSPSRLLLLLLCVPSIHGSSCPRLSVLLCWRRHLCFCILLMAIAYGLCCRFCSCIASASCDVQFCPHTVPFALCACSSYVQMLLCFVYHCQNLLAQVPTFQKC